MTDADVINIAPLRVSSPPLAGEGPAEPRPRLVKDPTAAERQRRSRANRKRDHSGGHVVTAHVGERGAAAAEIETLDAELAGKIEVAAHRVADLDARVAQIDAAIAEATRRGRTTGAISIMEGQRRARASLASEREQAAGALATLKAERASVAASRRRVETEAAPIRYVTELIGGGGDGERAIRWLIALMVLCCDPLATALTAAVSAR